MSRWKGLVAGESFTVRSPATSANLGPGFDSLGLALDLWDTYTATVSDRPGIRVAVSGEGSAGLPGDGTHLVARAMLRGLREAGIEPPGIDLDCRNVVPHGRGLGSSAAAIVGGLALARAMAPDGALPDAALVALATELEGHPDNVAAAVLGGATVAWTEAGAGRAVRVPADALPSVTVLVPRERAATEAARGLLPASVPRADAVFNVARAALLVHALAAAPELLFPATEDRLHQDYREAVYPASLAAVRAIRDKGLPAAVSGAGPSVIVFGEAPEVPAFMAMRLAVAGRGAHSVAPV